MTTITSISDDRPLRRDAERNRERILDAARELFAQRGLGVTLNDIAHHAGVGVGTVYRRFPDKARLVDELFEQRVAELVALIDIAAADPDPWHGITRFLEAALELQASDRALKELVTGMPDGLERVGRIRATLLPRGAEVVRRAHAAGKLRPDIHATDLPVIQLLLGTLIDASRDTEPDLWRRFLGILVRGIAADAESVPALSPGPLAPGQVDQVMSHLSRPGR